MATGQEEAMEQDRRRDFRTLLWATLVVLAIQNFLVGIWAFTVHGQGGAPGGGTYDRVNIYAVAMLCSAAASFVGGVIGFLFGIPRSAEGPADAVGPRPAQKIQVVRPDGDTVAGASEEAAPGTGVQQDGTRETPRERTTQPRLRSNTNLESISDALTKALLGIGLSQLHKVQNLVQAITETLGPSFGPGTAGGIVAICVLVYGAAEGFLFGYLATRVYLTGVFSRNDPQLG